MFGEIKVNRNWRKRYNKELMQLFGDLDVPSFVGISVLNRIGRVNRMNRKRKVIKVINNNHQGIRLRRRSLNRCWSCA